MSLTAAARLALENVRLQLQLRAQLDEVRQSRARLVEAADDGRRRLERDLHDGAQQQLVTLLFSLQLAKAEALQRSDPTTAHMLDGSIGSLRQALDELRSLARGIHPTILVGGAWLPPSDLLQSDVRSRSTWPATWTGWNRDLRRLFTSSRPRPSPMRSSIREHRAYGSSCVADTGGPSSKSRMMAWVERTCLGALAWLGYQTEWRQWAVDSTCGANRRMAPVCTPKFRARKQTRAHPALEFPQAS